ncbi:MAG: hypothetical protein E7522_07640 [Ruminococcaceae bacterium]|nr:hypothetical protein [Oscillospiraceae bacterium]
MLEKFITGAIIAGIFGGSPLLYKLGKKKKSETIQQGKIYYGLLYYRIIGFFVLGIISSEIILMLLLGDKVEGMVALLLMFVFSLPFTALYIYLYKKSFEKLLQKAEASLYSYSSKEKNDTQNQISHICLSVPNEPSKKQENFNVYSKDVLLDKSQEQEISSQPVKQEAPTVFTIESFANSLAKMASQELLDIMNLCSNKQSEFDERKLVISTFAYFYGIWVFNYKNVTTEQEKTIQEIYKKQFSDFNRTAFENDTFKQVVDNEYEFDKLLYYIIKRINESHEKFDDKQSFEYNKLSNEFISEFIVNEKYKEKIELDIKTKIMRDWALVASKTGQVSEIQKDK